MAGMISNVEALLKDQLICYQALNTLAEQKKVCLINKQIEELKTIIKREEEFAGKLLKLDKQTLKVLKDLALVVGVKGKTFKLKDVLECCEEKGEVLEVLRQELVYQMEGLQRQNQLNKALIEQSLELIDFSITAMHNSKMPTPIGYEHMGSNQQHGFSNFLDKKQ